MELECRMPQERAWQQQSVFLDPKLGATLPNPQYQASIYKSCRSWLWDLKGTRQRPRRCCYHSKELKTQHTIQPALDSAQTSKCWLPSQGFTRYQVQNSHQVWFFLQRQQSKARQPRTYIWKTRHSTLHFN